MKLFAAAMEASNHTSAEAVATEELEDWTGAQVRGRADGEGCILTSLP
ncbi:MULTISPECIES: hypothetical protein [Mesorhizobium]|uniref:Uncharacterized protein n=1 Tax=Mesorhizobium muleiense TaxID=1004279 RepID=A0A1G9DQI1_9HYPH|nr:MULTISPECIES: hypothetical protein [Mesorhizobium]MCF6101858.1 hypothetical protein [Mesorhizobium muleiense]SDK66147.1 hypothetical protein SAMN05428953_11897 [Mesorhizobium muleiense]